MTYSRLEKGGDGLENILKRSHFSQPVEFPNRYHLIHAPFLERRFTAFKWTFRKYGKFAFLKIESNKARNTVNQG